MTANLVDAARPAGGTACNTYHHDTSGVLHVGVDSLYVTFLPAAGDAGEPGRASMLAVYQECRRLADADLPAFRKGGVILESGAVLCPQSGWYDLAVKLGDVRVMMSSHVSQGVHVQVGPKFLQEHRADRVAAVRQVMRAVGFEPRLFERCDVARLDLCVDLMTGLPSVLDMLGDGWVSKATGWGIYGKRGEPQTIYRGQRGSSVFLRCYDKVAEAEKTGDMAYWESVWGGSPEKCCRVEWEMRPKRARLPLQLQDLTETKVRELFNSCLDWGRLCVPGNDTNRARWELHPFWAGVVSAVRAYCDGVLVSAQRVYDRRMNIGRQALKSGVGQVSSLIAKASVAAGLAEAGTLDDFLHYARGQGVGGRFESEVGRKFALLRAGNVPALGGF